MILNNLSELKVYLKKNELTPPDKKDRKEIVDNIEYEIKNLISRVEGLNNASITRGYKSGLNLYLRFPNSVLFITLTFSENIVKINISSPLNTAMFFPDLNFSMNNKILKAVSHLFVYKDETQIIFYEKNLKLDENYENNLLLSFIDVIEYMEEILMSIQEITKYFDINKAFYFDNESKLSVDTKEFEKLFITPQLKINYSEENTKLFSKLEKYPNDNQTKLIIAHLNMPLAVKYIYPYKSQLTNNELIEIYESAISAILICIDKYEAKASFAYYVSKRIFSNISRCKSQILRKRIYQIYESHPTFNEIDKYVRNFRNNNENRYPTIDVMFDYFTPIIKKRVEEKKLAERIKNKESYLKSSIPKFYNLVTSKTTRFKDRDIYKNFAVEINKSIEYVLEENESFIIKNRYLFNLEENTHSPAKTLEEVATKLSLTRERTRQIEKIALLKLKSIWTYIVPFNLENFESNSSSFFDSISPVYLNRSSDVKKLVVDLKNKGFFYKGLINTNLDLVLETGKKLNIDKAALKKYINFLSLEKNTEQKLTFQVEQKKISLNTNLDILNFSLRAKNVFKQNQIHTLEDLISYSEDDLMCMTNFGQTTLNEVIKKLEQYQLKLSDIDNWVKIEDHN